MSITQRTLSDRRALAWFRAATDQLAGFRAWVRSRLIGVGWLTDDRSDDVVLAASELATNAIEHGVGDEVSAEIDISDDSMIVAIESEGELPERAWRAPPVSPTSITGRGLSIVRSVADSVQHIAREGRTRIVARFDRPTS